MSTKLDLDSYRFGFQVGSFFHRDRYNFAPDVPGEKNHFQPNVQQIMAKNYCNPYTEIHRLFIMHDTGTGKTSLTWKIIREFFKVPAIQVVVLGFENSKEVFINEAIKYSEFGFVTRAEYRHLLELRGEYMQKKTPLAHQEYMNYARQLRMKVTGRGGTSVVFYGYQEFANRVGFRDENSYAGDIEINETFVDSFNGTVIIADEIPHTYNSQELNSRGRALKYVLDKHGKRVVFICHSATPLNNHPAESIELAQLLNDGPLRRGDYFRDEKLINEMGFIRLFDGKISTHHLPPEPGAFPELKWPENAAALGPIDPTIFAFIKCNMSAEQRTALADVQREEIGATEELDEDLNKSTYFLRDFVLTGEKGKALHTVHDLNYAWGGTAPHDQFDTPQKMAKFSAKYAQFSHDIKNARGKTIIFHPRVDWGIKLIAEIMEMMGYVDIDAMPHERTPCAICGRPFKAHEGTKKHDYHASRYAMINNYIGLNKRKSILGRFNSHENRRGIELQHLIGSEVILEGYNFTNIRHIYVLGFPDTFHKMMQLIGRGRRRESHRELDEGENDVTVHIYVSWNAEEETTPERYIIKWDTFVSNRHVLELMEEISIDRDFYESRDDRAPTKGRMDYYMWGLFDDDLANVYHAIKKLFMLRSVWKKDDLLAAIKNPPFRSTTNLSKISDKFIMYVLWKIVYLNSEKSTLQNIDMVRGYSAGALLFNMDTTAKYFIKGGEACVVTYKAPFFVLKQVNMVSHSIADTIYLAQDRITIPLQIEEQDARILMDEKKPSIALFHQYPIAIHERAIRMLIEGRDWSKPLCRFYLELGIVSKGDRENPPMYYRNFDAFKLVGESWLIVPYERAPMGEFVAYYDRQTFKIINIARSRLGSESAQGSGLKVNRTGRNRDKLDARQFDRGSACVSQTPTQIDEILHYIGATSKIGKGLNTLTICDTLERRFVDLQLSRGAKTTYLLFWGSPLSALQG